MEGPQRGATAAAIIASASPDEQGRVSFRRFCEEMVPRGTDPDLVEQVGEYMSRSFV